MLSGEIHGNAEEGFPEFLAMASDIQKDEFLLPNIADQMLKNGTEFTVLPTDDHWFGVTYKEDKPAVMESLSKLIELGEYQADLYSDLPRTGNRQGQESINRSAD